MALWNAEEPSERDLFPRFQAPRPVLTSLRRAFNPSPSGPARPTLPVRLVSHVMLGIARQPTLAI